ncbi:MAG: beta-eliminating lyase-related protein [Reyranellaceae bacterium]
MEDPTVNRATGSASSPGTEDAVFLPSGTMANQIAIRVHCRLGDEVIADRRRTSSTPRLAARRPMPG